jgi:23S rRNA pseudouridine1911/1915/1917 synthase
MTALKILYEDNHLLVVDKPAGIATMGAQSGPTMHSLASDYLKRTYHKPGKAFVGIVSRLDTMTSGVLVLARTSKSAARLSQQFAAKSSGVQKIYLAVVSPRLDAPQAHWHDRVWKDDLAHRMRCYDSVGPPPGQPLESSQPAQLQWVSMGSTAQHSLVAVHLLTGRKHQIRVQFADRGYPVVGDRKYGSPQAFPVGIALHSWRLRILHPTRRQPLWFSADPPPAWTKFRSLLGDPLERWLSLQTKFSLPDVRCGP